MNTSNIKKLKSNIDLFNKISFFLQIMANYFSSQIFLPHVTRVSALRTTFRQFIDKSQNMENLKLYKVKNASCCALI